MNIKQIIIFIVLLGIVFLAYRSQQLQRQYKSAVIEGLNRTKNLERPIITEKDITHLPEPVQKYLRYVGVIGKERVNSFRAVMDASMKLDKEKDWTKVQIKQYSFFDNITRLFFLNLNVNGIPFYGLHSYTNATATMDGKIVGLIHVLKGKGEIMNKAETVTILNDMCIMAPATLIDERIKWETIDAHTVKATFNNEGIEISAILYFNEKGQLINFVSDDRYYSPTGKTFEKATWSTPLSNYQNINGFNLPTYGEAIWNFPDGDFCYAKLNINEIEYNCKTLK
ncbi:DUF6544 family protein [Caldisalinibacter kiritimatiensis]|uniref:Uncharacterized protein n=1 Tax=Caldisalinibacter kiritimatiensis TaxID=1304284 RepID=R1CTH0_9FIRM|nr:DUF6544 family protein [Caldisalinibacter kiritimatiensis]EOC99973.1 hypothetical protein L21TH_1984 [Caldisalinibacter kiritimatiensis]